MYGFKKNKKHTDVARFDFISYAVPLQRLHSKFIVFIFSSSCWSQTVSRRSLTVYVGWLNWRLEWLSDVMSVDQSIQLHSFFLPVNFCTAESVLDVGSGTVTSSKADRTFFLKIQ